MPLTHVCVWDSKIGYRRITVEEACKMYPYGASARSGHFVCELCAQNVLLTVPGMNVQHFRHDPASPNKECDERQASFDPNYGRSLRALNSHIMPLRLVVTGSIFSLQLGFFYPPDNKAHCDKIKIAGDSHQVYEYSFERIERIGTTYLSVGSIPSQIYCVEYINANPELRRFWSNNIPGINQAGSFFDGRTGQILQSGGKAYVSEEKQSLRISAFKRLGLSKLLLGQLTRVLSDAKCILENPAKDKDLELLFGVLPLCVLTGRLDVLKDVIEGESGISSSVKAEVARYIEEE